jgi:uncharacterized protein YkwD
VRREQIVPWLVLAGLVVGFQAVPRLTASAGLQQDPTAAEAERIGWSEGELATAIARDLFDRLNDERAVRGLAPLRWHDGLAHRAQQWSRHMISAGDYRHSPGSFQAHPDFVGTGENILMLYVGSSDAHVGWMESDGHRENILHPGYSAVGIGAVCRNDGRLWATQIFGVSAGAAPGSGSVPRVDPIVRTDAGFDCPDVPFWQR